VTSPKLGKCILVAILVLGIGCAALLLTWSPPPEPRVPNGRAALLDSLAIEFPNPVLSREIEEALREANFTLDVYSYWNVSVDLYRNLPTVVYRLIILRVHTAAYYKEGRPVHVALGTGEMYSERKYLSLQLKKRLGALVLLTSDDRYFAIPPEFIESEMQGDFSGAIIIVGGCKGLITNVTARLLVERGASVVIGWDEDVTADHADRAIVCLVKRLAAGDTVASAVAETMRLLGPDPKYGAKLKFYPPEAGGVRLVGG